MKSLKKQKAKRDKLVAAAYAKANSKPRKKQVRVRTPLGRVTVDADLAIDARQTMRALKWRQRKLEKHLKLEAPKKAEEQSETKE